MTARTDKGYEYVSHNDMVMRTTETIWPTLKCADDLEYKLRYGKPTREELLMAASIMNAYSDICRKDSRRRAQVVRALRKADEVDPQKEARET